MKGDFLGFSFNGVHSDDIGVVRMSDGSRYSTDLTPEIEDRTNSVPGRDGVYFYGSDFKDGKISVKVAFDQLTDRQFRALRKWLGVKEPAPLIFDEFPFKKYMAKLASAPVFDYVCFDERRRWPSETAQDGVRVVDRTTVTEDVPYTEDLTVENGSSVIISRKPETVTVTYEDEQLTAEDFDYTSETGELSIHITDVESGDAINVTVDYTIEESRTEIEREQVYPYEYADDVERIYKGEGTIDFEIPFPYAIGAGVTVEDIREDASVPEQWEGASYLPTAAEYVEHGINQYDNGVIPVYNCGDIPTGFKLTLEPGSSSGSEGTATGNPITVNDALNADVVSLGVELEPVQDLHGYDKPWAGGAGKNKLQVTATTQTINGVTFTVNSDGTINANGTATADIIFVLNSDIRSDIISGTSIIVNGCPAGGSSSTYRIYCANVGYDYGNGVTGSVPNTSCACGIAIFNGYTANNVLFKPMIRLASVSDSTYAPYSNICPITGHDSVTITDTDGTSTNTTTVTLPHTVYGGDVDVTGGAGKEKYGIVDMGTLPWARDASSGMFSSQFTQSTNNSKAICTNYVNSGYISTTLMVNGQIQVRSNYIFVVDDKYTTAADFKTAMSGVMLCYELANYTDLTTTPTSVTLYNGDNTVSADGDMDLTYVKITTSGITYKDKHLDIDFSIMPFEENNDTAVVVDTFNRVIRGVDSGVLYNKCIVGGDFFLLDPSTDIDDSDEQISLALENSQFSSITYDYLFY